MTEPILSALKLVSLFHFKSRTYDQYIFQKADPHALNKSWTPSSRLQASSRQISAVMYEYIGKALMHDTNNDNRSATKFISKEHFKQTVDGGNNQTFWMPHSWNSIMCIIKR